MSSTHNEYFGSHNDIHCDGNEESTDFEYLNFAQCMGAPCWDTPYHGIWNVSCICPYHEVRDGWAFNSRDGECAAAKASTPCALVG